MIDKKKGICMRNQDTIAAIATGTTNAGISIIRISGEHAFSIAADAAVTYLELKLAVKTGHPLAGIAVFCFLGQKNKQ